VKIEKIIEPNPKITVLQEDTTEALSKLLQDSHVELVGAMAVPMTGRPEVDVMIISRNVAGDSRVLAENGYKQGPVKDDISFLKMMKEGVEIGVQIMSPESKMIDVHRGIIQKLREDSGLRGRYEIFKRSLAGLNRDEYKKQKSAWIKENLMPLLKGNSAGRI